jgi:hypothetical protein
VGVFQAGYKLCFPLEAPNKVWLIGKVRQNDFDRDLAPDSALKGPIDGAKAACAEPVT